MTLTLGEWPRIDGRAAANGVVLLYSRYFGEKTCVSYSKFRLHMSFVGAMPVRGRGLGPEGVTSTFRQRLRRGIAVPTTPIAEVFYHELSEDTTFEFGVP